MSAPKVGDIVRVEIEGKVNHEHDDGTLRVDFADNRQFAWVSPEHCTVILPPIAVGDVVDTVEKAEQLPVGSIVARTGRTGLACQLTRRGWETVSLDWNHVERLNIARPPVHSDAIVLRIGGGS